MIEQSSINPIYEPAEDSFLLAEQVKLNAFGRVLDIGTGSGIQALTASENDNVVSVLAVDINKKAVDELNRKIKKDKLVKIRAIYSNLFSNLKNKNQKSDTIIFNPPYLSDDSQFKNIALDGGKNGYEIVEKFLKKAGSYLKKDGIILLLFSSLTNKKKVEELIVENCFKFKKLSSKKIFYEELFVYLLTPNFDFVRNPVFLAKGKRGILYKGKCKDKIVVVKVKNPKSNAEGRIKNEYQWLKILNKKGIGPKLLFGGVDSGGVDYFVYEFVDGEFIEQYCQKNSKAEILRIIKHIFAQCFEMDKLKVDKEEMLRPFKHIICKKNRKPVMLDFERCRNTLKPKNVTQFSQYIVCSNFTDILRAKKFKIDKERVMVLAKEYKTSYSEENIKKILSSII